MFHSVEPRLLAFRGAYERRAACTWATRCCACRCTFFGRRSRTRCGRSNKDEAAARPLC